MAVTGTSAHREVSHDCAPPGGSFAGRGTVMEWAGLS